jgi:hypothetical protein
MKIQYVSKYLLLAEKGLVPGLECPMDQGPLMPNIDINDNIYLYCLSCTYKNLVGIDLYEKIVKKVEEAGDK